LQHSGVRAVTPRRRRNGFHIPHSDQSVNPGDLRQFVVKPLNQAARHHEPTDLPTLSASDRFPDCRESFVFGRLQKTARIYDEHIHTPVRRGQPVAVAR